VVGAEVGFSKIASEVPGVGFGEGTVSAVVLPVLEVDMVNEGAVVEPTDSSSSVSKADIDRLLGTPEKSPASRRDLRSVPNEPLRRLWVCVTWPIGRSLSWPTLLPSSSSTADIDNEAVTDERPPPPSMGVRAKGRVGPEEEPKRGRDMPNAPADGRREDEEGARRRAESLVEGRLEVAGERATAGVGGPSCPWSSICSRFASSVL
jgi:hypothetical protein